jgi:gliding motility-associated-like protein
MTDVFFNADSSIMWFRPSTTTSYTITVNGGLCALSSSLHFTINRTIVKADFTVDPATTDSEHPTFHLINNSTGATSYTWYWQGQQYSTQASPSITVRDTGKHCFMLVAANDAGCRDTAINCGFVGDGSLPVIFVPSAFSPNGDGVNDVLYVRGDKIASLDFRIYNRWGQMVFQSNDLSRGWDGTFKGKPQDNDVYSYVVIARTAIGKTVTRTGNVSLLQ